MTLSTLIMFLCGIIVEIMLLWERTRPQADDPGSGWLVIARLSRFQLWIGSLCLAALALAGACELIGVGAILVSLDDGWVGAIFVTLGVFIFFLGVWGNLLPKVNETSILSVQALVLVGLMTRPEVNFLGLGLWLAGLPALVVILLVGRKTALNPGLKAMVYLWYLVSLLILSFENGSFDTFNQAELNFLEGFAAGSVFIFLILHSLFSMRFFLIASSLILPRNRPYIQAIMPHLFGDEQIAPRQFIGLLAVVLAVVLLNRAAGLVSQTVLVNLSVLVCVQYLFRSERSGNPAHRAG